MTICDSLDLFLSYTHRLSAIITFTMSLNIFLSYSLQAVCHHYLYNVTQYIPLLLLKAVCHHYLYNVTQYIRLLLITGCLPSLPLQCHSIYSSPTHYRLSSIITFTMSLSIFLSYSLQAVFHHYLYNVTQYLPLLLITGCLPSLPLQCHSVSSSPTHTGCLHSLPSQCHSIYSSPTQTGCLHSLPSQCHSIYSSPTHRGCLHLLPSQCHSISSSPTSTGIGTCLLP